jgi:hypothetical protein
MITIALDGGDLLRVEVGEEVHPGWRALSGWIYSRSLGWRTLPARWQLDDVPAPYGYLQLSWCGVLRFGQKLTGRRERDALQRAGPNVHEPSPDTHGEWTAGDEEEYLYEAAVARREPPPARKPRTHSNPRDPDADR